MLDNPLEPIEELVLTNENWFNTPSFDKIEGPQRIKWLTGHKDYQQEKLRSGLSDEELEDISISGEIGAANNQITNLKAAFKESTANIQRCVLNLNDENSIKLFLRHLFDSIVFMKNELHNNGNVSGVEQDILESLNDYILYRYINKGFSKINTEADLRLKVGLETYEIKNYFNMLVESKVITNDDLDLFLHSNFYGFDPRMEVKEKIEVKTTQANLRHFMYRFKEDNRLFEIDQKKFVALLHNSFTCFDGVEQATTYKKMSQKPAKFDLL